MSDHSNTQENEDVGANNHRKAVISYSRIKRQILSHVTLVRIVIASLLIVVAVLLGFLIKTGISSLNIPIYYNTVHNFISLPIEQLASYNDRTNILVMGRAGGSHEGPDLTDTIMLVSISLKERNVKIISIPRDTWVPEIRAKINSAYYWGNEKKLGGITFAKAVTSQVVGLPIQYGALIDFSGFKDIIDEIGGIEVNIENSFTDELYPVAGKENDTCGGNDPKYLCRYEILTFEKGLQKMDGETALKFVRSRHALGIEGTDIARAARQQKVLDALKNKLSNKKMYTNPLRDIALIKVVLRSITTDIDYPTAGILARLIYESRDSITSYIIPEGMLITPPISEKYDMQSVFIPKEGNGKWEKIDEWILTTLQN